MYFLKGDYYKLSGGRPFDHLVYPGRYLSTLVP